MGYFSRVAASCYCREDIPSSLAKEMYDMYLYRPATPLPILEQRSRIARGHPSVFQVTGLLAISPASYHRLRANSEVGSLHENEGSVWVWRGPWGAGLIKVA